jgi:hypothetical protein
MGSKGYMNVLLHHEIVASKPSAKESQSENSSGTSDGLSSILSPSELNISEGLAGTLVDHIITEMLPPEVVI